MSPEVLDPLQISESFPNNSFIIYSLGNHSYKIWGKKVERLTMHPMILPTRVPLPSPTTEMTHEINNTTTLG
jgi:hypothetical protein